MNKCDIVNQALEDIITEAEGNQTEADIWVDDRIQIDSDHKSLSNTKILKHLMRRSLKRQAKKQAKHLDEKVIRKAFGELSDREYLAGKIRMIIGSVPQLSQAMVEELYLQVRGMGLKLKKTPWEINKETGEPKLHLYRLPVPALTRLNNMMEAWATADPDKFDSWYYRNIRLPWGITRKIRMTENSGAYHNVWQATQNFADRQGFHIDKFMKGEEGKATDEVDIRVRDEQGNIKDDKRKIRQYGMEDIIRDVENLYFNIPEQDRIKWEQGGFFKGRSQQQAQAHFMEIFTWMMHGRIEYVDESRVKIMTKGTRDEPSELVYKYGPGMYIYTKNSPTTKAHESTGDVVFGWQKPMPLKYNPAIHGDEKNMKIFDHKGNERYDTLKLIKDAPPMTQEMMDSLLELTDKARPILDESHQWFNDRTQLSYMKILQALTKLFPKKSLDDLKRAFTFNKFTDKNNTANWSAKELKKFKYLEENFTKWSLAAPFNPTIDTAAYKKNYFPYIYMPEIYALLLQDAIESLEVSIESTDSAFKAAKGEAKQTLSSKLKALKASLANQKAMKEQMIAMDVDHFNETKMVTRMNSKHFKHITNALDVFKSRTDSGVFQSMLEHNARTVERNNLTASLLESLSMTEHTGVRDAFISLYRATLGRGDARSLIFGKDLSDIKFNPKTIRGLKAVRKYYNLMLAKPATAMRQYMGHIEKYNKEGMVNTLEAFTILHSQEKDLERMFQESGVTVFTDFFTNSIVAELEKLEADRDTIDKMTQAYVKFFTDKGSTKNKSEKLHNTLTKLFGRPMKWENVLNKDEALKFNAKMKADKLQRLTNKITNWAISNENPMREAMRHAPVTSWLAKGVDFTVAFRRHVRDFAVMSAAESKLRKTSFILGIRAAQRAGELPNIEIYKLKGTDRTKAIKIGRDATNLMFDFSMSRQGVGESYRGAFGSLLGQFTVWKSQKAASDIDLMIYASQAMNNSVTGYTTPISIVKAMNKAVTTPDIVLERTDPDALKLKRWLRGQFLIEGMMQMAMIAPLLPDMIKSIMYATGARNMSAAGSPVAGMIWAPIIMGATMFYNSFADDPWDDEEEMERYLSTQLRNIPSVGVGTGFVYDATALLLALIAEEESIAKQKLKSMSGYAAPMPGGKKAIETAVKVGGALAGQLE